MNDDFRDIYHVSKNSHNTASASDEVHPTQQSKQPRKDNPAGRMKCVHAGEKEPQGPKMNESCEGRGEHEATSLVRRHPAPCNEDRNRPRTLLRLGLNTTYIRSSAVGLDGLIPYAPPRTVNP